MSKHKKIKVICLKCGREYFKQYDKDWEGTCTDCWRGFLKTKWKIRKVKMLPREVR
jgi:ribosomal protein L37E